MIVAWDDIKKRPLKKLKLSLFAMIPHESRKWRGILDLSFSLRMAMHEIFKLANKITTKTAPQGAIDQMGHALQRIIHAFTEVEEYEKIFLAKWDIKDGF